MNWRDGDRAPPPHEKIVEQRYGISAGTVPYRGGGGGKGLHSGENLGARAPVAKQHHRAVGIHHQQRAAANEPLHEIGAPQPKFSSVQMAPPQRRDS